MSTLAGSDRNSTLHHLASDSLRHAALNSHEIANFLNPGEIIFGYGYGGSESVTIFVRDQDGIEKVRKILSNRFITTLWDHRGRDVMLPPHLKAESQAKWLQNLPNGAKPFFPAVLDLRSVSSDRSDHHEFIYDMSYVPGVEFSRFVREHKPCPALVAYLYSELFILLARRVHRYRRRVPQSPTLEGSYFKKIDQRLYLCHHTAPATFPLSFLNSRSIYINHVKYRNVSTILSLLRSNKHWQGILEPRLHSLVVGDTNTENIRIGNIAPLQAVASSFDFENPPFRTDDLEIRFLDPRAIGFHEAGTDSGADDPMYDNKPWHNSLGHYDMIHGEHFDLEAKVEQETPALNIHFHAENPYRKSYEGIESYFHKAMTRAWGLDNVYSPFIKHDPYWLIRFVFVMGTHFMAMPPFHFGKNKEGAFVDNPRHQSRPLAIYAEGVQWLNLALDMLEGSVQEYLGCAVPKINSSLPVDPWEKAPPAATCF